MASSTSSPAPANRNAPAAPWKRPRWKSDSQPSGGGGWPTFGPDGASVRQDAEHLPGLQRLKPQPLELNEPGIAVPDRLIARIGAHLGRELERAVWQSLRDVERTSGDCPLKHVDRARCLAGKGEFDRIGPFRIGSAPALDGWRRLRLGHFERGKIIGQKSAVGLRPTFECIGCKAGALERRRYLRRQARLSHCKNCSRR
jgi:hypothetical protein